MEIQVQRALENRGLESLMGISKDVEDALKEKIPIVVTHVQDLFRKHPGALLTSEVKGEILALVEEKNALLGSDLGAKVEETKVEFNSEMQDLRVIVEGGAQERQALEQKVALLSQKPPPPLNPDPLLQQVPTLVGSVQTYIAHLGAVDRAYRGVNAQVVSFASTVDKIFKGAQAQIFAQARDMASLKSANERLEAQNARLMNQLATMGETLKSVVSQVAQNSQLFAQTQSQGQAVQGRVLGMESGMAQVMAQVGSLGREVQQQKASVAPIPPPVNVTLRVDPRYVVPESEGGPGTYASTDTITEWTPTL